MNKVQTIIVVVMCQTLVPVLSSCSDSRKQEDLRKYSELYVHYCRAGTFDSLAMDAGRVFAARNDGIPRRLRYFLTTIRKPKLIWTLFRNLTAGRITLSFPPCSTGFRPRMR